MESMWGYPYRLGIGLFLIVSTFLFTAMWVGITWWLEVHFKKGRQKK